MRPALLKRNDRIGIVAPSRVIDRSQMERAYEVLADWGLEVQDGKSLFGKSGYFAGTDEERLSDLQEFINDPEIKAIFCARGGYGMTRILDNLDLNPLKENPKWIIGFSDITALHLKLALNDIESIHGLMPVQYGYEGVSESLQSLRTLLFEGKGKINAPASSFNCLGDVSGKMIGGNLSLVAECLGTETEIETDGKILFLEEIDEYLYKIDRMFTQIKRAGKLNGLGGLIIGDFSGMKDTQIPFGMDVNELITKQVREFDFPVAFDFPIGHESKNIAVPVSREARLVVDKSGAKLSF